MKVGIVGLGKLGLPVALALEAAGHDVAGWDVSETVRAIIERRGPLPYREAGADELLAETRIRLLEPAELAAGSDLVLVAVQTPHQPRFEGTTRLPRDRADFDYSWLRAAVESVADASTVAVVSTVLPGTLEREILPIVDRSRLLYAPSFIAMGTTIPDFRRPEFVLVGTDGAHYGPLRELHEKVHDQPLFVTTIRTAELTKVAYNTFIGLKLAFANTMMEICEKTGADVDDLVDALSLATDRIVSPAYLRGGMGDGGGCHPRDNIALSWLARELDLSYDLFDALMTARERQTEWLGRVALERAGDRPLTILGKAYKPGTALTVGSPALLLAELLRERGVPFDHLDPLVDA